jgi:hypothetical protein
MKNLSDDAYAASIAQNCKNSQGICRIHPIIGVSDPGKPGVRPEGLPVGNPLDLKGSAIGRAFFSCALRRAAGVRLISRRRATIWQSERIGLI